MQVFTGAKSLKNDLCVVDKNWLNHGLFKSGDTDIHQKKRIENILSKIRYHLFLFTSMTKIFYSSVKPTDDILIGIVDACSMFSTRESRVTTVLS